jgi:hypothetical protein
MVITRRSNHNNDSSNKNKVTPPPRRRTSTEDSTASASNSASRKRKVTTKKGKEPEVDRALVEFLRSPFRKLGLAFYASHTSNLSLLGQPGSQQRKASENRLNYIKKLQQTEGERFLELCENLDINGIQQPDFSEDSKDFFEDSKVPDSPSPAPIKLEQQLPKNSANQRKLPKPSPVPPPVPTAMMARNIHETFVQELEFNLNFDLPELNPKGIFVLHAKDVKVKVGDVEELKDKVTIVKPLFDPR